MDLDLLPFTPYEDPALWVPLSAEQRELWVPEQVEVYDAYRWRNLVRHTPADFARMTTRNWIDFAHITYISNIIADFIHDRLIAPNGRPAERLFLTMPPRHGKSFLLSEHVPAWYLSMFPDEQVILTTYEANFAAKWGGKVRNLVQEHGQKFGLSLAADSQAKNRWSLAKPHLGGMITAGMGGPITGEGGGLLIGDDWVKNAEEANSEVWRENAWDWFNTTFKTRGQKDLNDPNAKEPKMLLLMTRWHDDDPMGRLLQGAASAGNMVVIHLPALATEADDPLGRQPGEALCPQIKTAEQLAEMKREDPSSFNALFQGDPTPEEGGLFSKSNFRKWRYAAAYSGEVPEQGGREALTDAYILQTPEGAHLPVPVKDCRHFITCDLAISEKKRADYSVFSLWAMTPERDLLLVNRFRDRIEEAEHVTSLARFHDEAQATLGRQSKIRLVGVEKATFGITLLKNARRETGMPMYELEPDLDKYARAIPAGALVKGGKFYLPEHVDWSDEFIAECTGFPTATHDDQVDTFSYAADLMAKVFRGARKPTRQEAAEAQGEDGRIEAHILRTEAALRKKKRQSARRGGW